MRRLLERLNDPLANLQELVEPLQADPMLSARALTLANALGHGAHPDAAAINDLQTATALIGLKRLRNVVLIGSLSNLFIRCLPTALVGHFWPHSLSVGVAAHELVLAQGLPIDPHLALAAGLLHDVGQLWLFMHDPAAAQACWAQAQVQAQPAEQAEFAHWGLDHAELGGWLCRHWQLDPRLCTAVAQHHAPQPGENPEPGLADVVHVAEVLSNALSSSAWASVHSLSAAACARLGLLWDETSLGLLGRIDAHCQHALALYGGSAADASAPAGPACSAGSAPRVLYNKEHVTHV